MASQNSSHRHRGPRAVNSTGSAPLAAASRNNALAHRLPDRTTYCASGCALQAPTCAGSAHLTRSNLNRRPSLPQLSFVLLSCHLRRNLSLCSPIIPN